VSRLLVSPHLTAGYAPALERAYAYTVAGQADFCDPDSNFACAQCAHWRASKARGKGRCAEWSRRMLGREGPVLRAAQQACRAFEARG
jgi:hypothetical protein